MKLVADESVDYGIIKLLRQNGFEAISIFEQHAGIKDSEVLKLANAHQSLLITEDKDFGELVYRLQYKHDGILLIRLNDLARNERITFVLDVLLLHYYKLLNHFSVLNSKGLRIKTIYLK